ncbi:DUF5403 family protein [Nocardia sp. IFM 10818]
MAGIYLQSDKSMNGRVSRMDPVQDALGKAAEDMLMKAEAGLAAHRKSGNTKVEKTRVKGKYKTIDYEVALVGKNAVAIEYGHQPSGLFEGTDTKPPEGLYILHRAAGLA